MTLSNSLTLRHNKYVAYIQIWAAFCLAILASDFFNFFEIRTNIAQFFVLNNFRVALMLGVIGYMYFRSQLHFIERMARSPHVRN
jgi:hypothetical protein